MTNFGFGNGAGNTGTAVRCGIFASGNGTATTLPGQLNPTTGRGNVSAHLRVAFAHRKIARANPGWFLANCQCRTCVRNQRKFISAGLLTPSQYKERALYEKTVKRQRRTLEKQVAARRGRL